MHPILTFLVNEPVTPDAFYACCDADGFNRTDKAMLLDAGLRVIGWVENLARRTYAIGLARLSDHQGQGLMQLGYAALKDYARERPGLGTMQAYQLASVARGCREFARVDTAWKEGRLSYSKVRLLVGSLKPEQEAEWVVRAEGMTVRALDNALKELKAMDALPGPADDDAPAVGCTLQGTFSHLQASLWDRAAERARRLLGSEASDTECLQVLLAEFLTSRAAETPHVAVPDTASQTRAIEERRTRAQAARQHFEQRSRQWEALDWSAVPIELSEELTVAEDADAFAVDAVLMQVRRLSLRLRSWQRRLLRLFRDSALWTDLQFSSLGHYTEERLGMSASSAWEQADLDRELDLWTELADALRTGTISPSQAQELLKVRHVETQAAWLEHARTVTVQQLQDDVAAAQRRPGLLAWPPSHDPKVVATLEEVLTPAGLASAVAAVPLLLPIPATLLAVTRFQTCTKAEDLELPARSFRIWLPADMEELWQTACAIMRHLSGENGTTDRVLATLAFYFLQETEAEAQREARLHPILERDGFRCTVPGCTMRSTLESHHVQFRSQGGPDTSPNQTSLCYRHHHHGIHGGHIKLTGSAPLHLVWRLGTGSGRKPHMVIAGRRILQSS